MGNPDRPGLREEIIEVSLELGTELGEDGVTMRGIAGKLGVSATALYQYFESKAAILQELRMYGMFQMAQALAPAYEIEDARKSLQEAARCYISFARKNPWLYALLMQDSDVPPDDHLTDEQLHGVRGLREQVRDRVYERYQQFFGADGSGAIEFFGNWWAGLHGLASLIIGRRIGPKHPVLPISDIDAFVEQYIQKHVDCLASEPDP